MSVLQKSSAMDKTTGTLNIRADIRDSQDRLIDERSEKQRKEKITDKTLAESLPATDPHSSWPDPEDNSFSSPVAKSSSPTGCGPTNRSSRELVLLPALRRWQRAFLVRWIPIV